MTRFVCIAAFLSAFAWGQTFSSGSNGSDGALNLTTPGTVIFDPVALNLNPAADNVFNFTTINIASGVTVKLLNAQLRGKPVVWLASGAVTIAGTLDASGMPGAVTNDPVRANRRPADPGPGGYPGGVGAGFGSGPQSGVGPGGGAGGGCSNPIKGAGAGHAGGGECVCGCAGAYGNVVLVPLRGGSGGGGGNTQAVAGGGGGGGGGALRIESSASITLSGSVISNGGDGGSGGPSDPSTGGGGSGGAIHLIGTSVTGVGSLSARGGAGANVAVGSVGRIRVDAFTQGLTGTSNPAASFGTPYAVPPPTAQPMVRVTSIGGISVPPNPTGSFVTPDVVLNNPNPVTVNIQASNVPLGTVVTLYLFSEVGTDVTINSTALAGTLANSTATVQATFQPGYTRGFVRATF
jgi:hypothetical protein